jgi:predicted metal-dependent hydrolase
MNDPTAEESAILARGVALFNEGEYWEAHEAWEELWLEAKPPLRLFVQGLIQLAAAWHHVRRGNHRGAERLFRSGLEKLAPYRPVYAGIDVSDAAARADEMLVGGIAVGPAAQPVLTLREGTFGGAGPSPRT